MEKYSNLSILWKDKTHYLERKGDLNSTRDQEDLRIEASRISRIST